MENEHSKYRLPLHFGVSRPHLIPFSSTYKLCDLRQVIKFSEPQFLHLLNHNCKSGSLTEISQAENDKYCMVSVTREKKIFLSQNQK